MTRPARRLASAGALGIILLLSAAPATVDAHPLGNFTINHYAGLRIEGDRVVLDIVIDQAEIPTFTARGAIDLDSDGQLSETEIDAAREATCESLLPSLQLTAGDAPIALTLEVAGLSFPPGAAGLSTMRVVCGLEGILPAPLGSSPTRIRFSDGSFAERIGWREIVLSASGATVAVVEGEMRDTSPSNRLTAYPKELLPQPLADRSITINATAGGPILPATPIVDARPLAGAVVPSAPASQPSSAPPSSAPPSSPSPSIGLGVVPGGVSGGELPSIFRATDLTPLVILLSFVSAIALGAGHALTPGHGKTLMAAYLVGTRGTPLHALGLGLSVSLSHTIGILLLAAVVLGAADVLPPDLVVRTTPILAAASIVAIGAWMLLGEWRRRRAAALSRAAHAEVLDSGSGHDPGADGVAHEHPHRHDHDHGEPHAHDHGEHAPDEHGHGALDQAGSQPDALEQSGEHSHGGVRHSHLPPAGGTITWRSLFVLGLAGGLIPSTSALLILLGSIAAGRPAFGFLLVVAFGLGMAAVMSGVGLVMVAARGRLDRLPSAGGLGRIREAVPLVAALLVFGFGIYLTAQAIGGTLVL
ncbi:MAG: hypothetical protein WKF56_02255 [Candidatus Limnocylindrales bacterium]